MNGGVWGEAMLMVNKYSEDCLKNQEENQESREPGEHKENNFIPSFCCGTKTIHKSVEFKHCKVN